MHAHKYRTNDFSFILFFTKRVKKTKKKVELNYGRGISLKAPGSLCTWPLDIVLDVRCRIRLASRLSVHQQFPFETTLWKFNTIINILCTSNSPHVNKIFRARYVGKLWFSDESNSKSQKHIIWSITNTAHK